MNKRSQQKTVYVLGAGFSRSVNPSSVPLMADFLRMAKAKGTYRTTRPDNQLAMFIDRYFGYVEYNDLEKVMSFLASPPLDDPIVQSENRPALYDKLIRLIQETLAEVDIIPMSGFTQRAYSGFAEHLVDTHSTVVSFNYDLLLDSLLYKTGKWIGFDGYGADIPSAYQALPRPSRTKMGDYTLPNGFRSNTYLLKPHGSINWGKPTLSPLSDKTIYQDPFGCYYNPSGLGPRPLSDASIKPADLPLTIRFKPFIVPPVLDKSSLLDVHTLKVIWNSAREAIQNADRLIFIGYSLPSTDFATEFLFRQAIQKSRKEVVVVSPDESPSFKDRYKDVFRHQLEFFKGDTLDWIRDSGIVPNLNRAQSVAI